MSIDANRLLKTMLFFHLIWSGPLQIIVALFFLYCVIGLAAIAGFVVLLLLLPVTVFVFVLGRYFQAKLMKIKDKRIKLIYEVLSGIKVNKVSNNYTLHYSCRLSNFMLGKYPLDK